MTEFKNVAIVGAGVMGHGIAVVYAVGGCTVLLYDVSEAALASAERQIAAALATLAQGKVVTGPEIDAARKRISYLRDLKRTLASADLVVEAIVENVEAKRKLYAEIAGLMSPTAVLASNTSYINIFPLLPASLKNRTLIVHWYTPPYIIDLVDVVPGVDVPSALTDRMVAFLSALGKQPVRLKKFVSGYLANRVQMAIESEIFKLLDSGVADAAEIDRSIRFGLALRLALFGQFKKIDFTGLRNVRDSHKGGFYDPPTKPTGSAQLDKLVEQGREGVLSGAGFYDYTGQSAGDLYRKRDLDLLALKAVVKAMEHGKGGLTAAALPR